MANDQMICEGSLPGCTNMTCLHRKYHEESVGCHDLCNRRKFGGIPGSRCVPAPAEEPIIISRAVPLVQPDSLRAAVEKLHQYYAYRGYEDVPADEVASDLRKVLEGRVFMVNTTKGCGHE